MKEKIFFKNSKGDKLCGILSNQTNDNTRPIIILCHGFTSSKESPTYIKLEEIFNNNNISTLRFDFYGHGESEGMFEDVTVSEAVDDILRAIDFLKEKGYSRIGLVGSSFGGSSSIMAASRTNDLFALGLIAPVSDYEEVAIKKYGKESIERGYVNHLKKDGGKLKINYSFFEDFKNNNGYEAAKKIRIPVLIVHGDSDQTVPLEQSKKTSKLIENCKLEIIEGGGHSFKYEPENFKKVIKLISDFILKNI